MWPTNASLRKKGDIPYYNFASPIFNFSLLPDFDLKNGFTSKSVKN
jgi:hypothetical protein